MTSLVWITATIVFYAFGRWMHQRLGNHPLAHPVLLAILLVMGLLLATDTPYTVYASSTWPITFLLGPATVALGLPLGENLSHVRRSLGMVCLGLGLGSLVSILVGTGLVMALGGTREVALSMAPKAATTPIAILVAEQVGGQPALTASLAIVGGILAAMMVMGVTGRLGIRDWRAVGLAAGTAGSAVGASRVAPLDSTAAAFAALGIGLNGLATSILVPLLVRFWKP
jgi:putative effector of murein hydrolase